MHRVMTHARPDDCCTADATRRGGRHPSTPGTWRGSCARGDEGPVRLLLGVGGPRGERGSGSALAAARGVVGVPVLNTLPLFARDVTQAAAAPSRTWLRLQGVQVWSVGALRVGGWRVRVYRRGSNGAPVSRRLTGCHPAWCCCCIIAQPPGGGFWFLPHCLFCFPFSASVQLSALRSRRVM